MGLNQVYIHMFIIGNQVQNFKSRNKDISGYKSQFELPGQI